MDSICHWLPVLVAHLFWWCAINSKLGEMIPPGGMISWVFSREFLYDYHFVGEVSQCFLMWWILLECEVWPSSQINNRPRWTGRNIKNSSLRIKYNVLDTTTNRWNRCMVSGSKHFLHFFLVTLFSYQCVYSFATSLQVLIYLLYFLGVQQHSKIRHQVYCWGAEGKEWVEHW
jgi:hypothetical protein